MSKMYLASLGSKIVSILPASYRQSRHLSPLMPTRSRPATSIAIAKMCWFDKPLVGLDDLARLRLIGIGAGLASWAASFFGSPARLRGLAAAGWAGGRVLPRGG